MNAVDIAVAKIIADGAAHGEQIAADKAREVTVTANLYRNNGDVEGVTATGIAPFEAVKTAGNFSGLPGWTVHGQPYASRNGMRSTILTGSDPRYLGVGLLSMGEAAELARDLNAEVLK